MAPLALTVDEASEAAHVGRMVIYNAINAGNLPARKNGRRTLILAADLEVWLRGLPSYSLDSSRRCAPPRRSHKAA